MESSIKKGIILVGGKSTRLYPATLSVSKALLPVYDKPMIFYSVASMLLAGVRDILVIASPRDNQFYKDLLGNGEQFGATISYGVQEVPRGIADAFLVGENFIGDDGVFLMLGDNLIHGSGIEEQLQQSCQKKDGATVFCYHVEDPSRYGVAVMDSEKKVVDIIEKPKEYISPWAVIGVYFYDNKAIEFAKGLAPSNRGEIEITDLNREYLKRGKLSAEFLGDGCTWFDVGTHEALLEAGDFVRKTESLQKKKIGCPYEIAYNKGFIDNKQLLRNVDTIGDNDYGRYLKSLIK